jgi:predicted ATP-dependent endonuclease of OLD family
MSNIKIKRMSIKKYRCLENFEANFDGHNILICGDNAVGKSTLIQFCQVVLGDKKELPPGLNADGEMVIDKSGQKWKLKLKIIDGKREITATSEAGVKNKTLSFLADLVGAIEFNVWDFVEKGKTEAGQREMVGMLKSMHPVEERQKIDFLETEIEKFKNAVTEKNRVVKSLQNVVDMSSAQFCDKPLETSDLMRELQHATKVNETIKKAKDAVVSRETEIQQINKQIGDLMAKKGDAQQSLTKASEFLKNNLEIDTIIIENKIKQQDEEQKKYHDWMSYLQKKSELETYQKAALEEKSKLDVMRSERLSMIAGKSNLLEGLKISDDGLYYKGVLVSDKTMSTSEIMMLGVLLKQLENPGQIIFLNQMESLGKEAMQALANLSKLHNFQIIGEEVRRGEEKLQIEIFGE